MHHALRTLLVSTLIAACEGDQGPPGPAGPPGPIDPDAPALDKAFAGIGGRDALAELATLRITASGERLLTLEGYVPEDKAHPISTFASTTSLDLAADRLRIDYNRTLFVFGQMKDYSVVIDGTRGAIVGVESAFGFLGGLLSSDRWAATLRQQRLLYPHLLLRDVAHGSLAATDKGLALRDGQLRHRVDVADPVRAFSLYIDRFTGEIVELETAENDHVAGDTSIEVHYQGWRTYEGTTVRFPSDVIIATNDQPIHAERRDAIAANTTLDPATFVLPDGNYTHDDTAAARGARNAHFHEGFAALGVPLDGLQTFIEAQQIGAGVWHLRGGSHHSLVVEQANGVVVVEPPLYEARGKAIYQWLATNIPNKPVTHVVVTHHHRDHVGALRTFVARGARVVVGAAARPYFAQAVRAARTIEPDELAAAPRAATFDVVAPNTTLVLPDAQRPVRVVAIESTHSADLLVAYVPSTKTVFVSDIYSPGLPGGPVGARELKTGIAALDVTNIAGGHGGIGTKADLDAAAQ